MPDPGRQLLILQTSAATARRHPGFESPYSAAEVAKIADEHRFKVKDGVASWLEVHADDPEEAFDVLESFLRTDTAFASVEAGTLAYVDRLDAAQRLTLARLELERSESRRIRTEFLRAVRFGEVDDLMGADLIVTEYKRTGTNNDRRRDLLDAWHVLQVTSPTARTRLIDEVMLPMLADGGKTGLDHVRTRMDLVYDPHGRKNALRDAMRAVVGGKGKDSRLESAMKRNRILRERKGRFGLITHEVDE